MWEISYANLNMLLATIPTYETEEEKKKAPEEVVDGVDELKDFLNM